MEDYQWRRLYEQATSHMVNPPSFETWLKWQREMIYNAYALKAADEEADGFWHELKKVVR